MFDLRLKITLVLVTKSLSKVKVQCYLTARKIKLKNSVQLFNFFYLYPLTSLKARHC